MLNEHDVVVLLLSLGLLLGVARTFGEIAKRLGQPAVLGELLGGVILGPSVLGAVSPELFTELFPKVGAAASARSGLTTVALTLFMLMAGIEVQLPLAWKQGRSALVVSLMGILVPFVVGFSVALWLPERLGRGATDPTLFALFFATALSISALPVIAKTLMDMGLYQSELGMLVIAAAVVDDLAGWLIFATLLGLMRGSAHGPLDVVGTVVMTVGLTALVLTAGRWLAHRAVVWLQAGRGGSAGVLTFAFVLAMLGASLTEWIGIHAIFGAFLFGVAVGDSPALRQHLRTIIYQFVGAVFGPLFFASVGLRVDLTRHFDPLMVVLVIVVACAGKLLGGAIAGKLLKTPRRESLAVGFAMNARGAMEMILGLVALQAGLITEPLFVALVTMAMVTSMMAGPALRRLLRLGRPQRLTSWAEGRGFVGRLQARTGLEAAEEAARSVAAAYELDVEAVAAAVVHREAIATTALGHGVAAPHAKLPGLKAPVVGIATSPEGIDFDAPDGLPVHVVLLVLTPADAPTAQVEILADIARSLRRPDVVQAILRAQSYDEVIAALAPRGE